MAPSSFLQVQERMNHQHVAEGFIFHKLVTRLTIPFSFLFLENSCKSCREKHNLPWLCDSFKLAVVHSFEKRVEGEGFFSPRSSLFQCVLWNYLKQRRLGKLERKEVVFQQDLLLIKKYAFALPPP